MASGDSPLLVMGKDLQPNKARKPRKPKMGESGSAVTQVGEVNTGKEPKAPTPYHMEKESAKHSMVHATRRWVDGEISTRERDRIHGRAKAVMKGKHRRK